MLSNFGLPEYLRLLIIFADKEGVVIFLETILTLKDGFISKLLLGCGWCPNEAIRLCFKFGPSAIYYASTIENSGVGNRTRIAAGISAGQRSWMKRTI